MMLSRFHRRVLLAIAMGVGLPALLLALLGVYLTFRISQSVINDTVRYNSYLGQQVAQAYEDELMDHLRRAIAPAENAARDGRSNEMVQAALAAEGQEFGGAHFVPVDDLAGYSLIMVEAIPMLYAPGGRGRPGQYFCGLLLRDPDGNVIGAGGWWVDVGDFLLRHLETVLQERLPGNPRLYGGIELTRQVSIEVLDPDGQRVGRIRELSDLRTSRVDRLGGPFENYSVRVGVTGDAPVVWTGRFLALEVGFIGAMGLMIVLASLFGYRYTLRQLELAQLKAGFVSNVTHELKTPIAMIRLAVETLEMQRVQTREEAQKFLGIISRETQRLTQLVETILDFARLEAGQAAFRFAAVDVGGQVAEAVESLKPRLDHLGFTVQLDLAEDLPPVRADSNALNHCLLNLLDNAIKYSRERREITISARAREGAVAVSVADQGIGIAPGDRKRIFEKFVRVENGLVHDVRGAGLGLSLVDQIIRAHHGRIEVESTPGQGSTFTLLLPLAETPAPQGAAGAHPAT
jgi:signal transduction histidine kinase